MAEKMSKSKQKVAGPRKSRVVWMQKRVVRCGDNEIKDESKTTAGG